MGRASTKENKNRYQLVREELGLSRERDSELLESISPERLEKIENERSDPHPDEVLLMSQKYCKPSLCNYYCANECPIGQQCEPIDENHAKSLQNSYPPAKKPGDFAFYGTFDE